MTEAGKALSDDIDLFAGQTGVKPGPLFTAAFAAALSVYSAGGEKSSCFVTAGNGRHGAELSATTGMLVRTLPVRIDIPASGSTRAFLEQVRNVIRGTLRNDCISFGELAAEYGVNTDIAFVYQGGLISELSIGGVSVMPDELPLRDYRNHMLCMVLKTAAGYALRVHYRRECYSAGFISRFSETILAVLKGLITCEDMSGIDPVADSQKAFIDSVNSTEQSFDPAETVGSVFAETVWKYPENTALVYGDKRRTYAEFEQITRNIAACIAGKGIGREDFVAVLMPRNDAAVLAAWGIIRSGAGFQMLDPGYPPERLNYMVRDSRAKLLFADRSLMHLLDGYSGDVIYADEMLSLPAAAKLRAEERPGNALTLIYTSGTTGNPKGCVLENRNLTAFFHNHVQNMRITSASRVASYASFGFDAGVMDIVTTLMAGAGLYIVPDEIRLDPGRLEAFFCENGITHGFMTTQVGRAFAEETRCGTLQALLVGGEKLVPFTPGGAFRFVNGYGPCETIAYVCHHDVTDNSPVQPIGRPGGNTKLYVLDQRMRMVPVGAPGELAVSGLQVGRGYLGLPQKTAEVFVKNPFTSAPGYERMYRTGDVVRMLPSGELEYIGRRDSQVKIRGFRVELTEVEEIIRRFPGIRDATVTAPEDNGGSGGRYLAAYVVSTETVDFDALSAFIRAEKPAYMVPAAWMQLESIPYTRNQKVDRRALPVPVRARKSAEQPVTEAQKKAFEAASAVLGHTEFGITDDLFDAGLTSIGMLKLNTALAKAFGVPVKISDIREHPTVKELAELLEDTGHGEACQVLEAYPLMSNQMGIFVECAMNRDTTQYNIPLLLKLSAAIDPERLRKAVCRAIDAHPYLKATLKNENGDVLAVRNDSAEAAAELIRTGEEGLPGVRDLVRPFELLGGRLYRAAVYVTGSGNYLFLDIHHILADGTSMAVLLRDIDAAYAGETVETERYTGFEAAAEEQRASTPENRNAAEQYYEALLSGANTECLPGKCPEKDPAGDCASFSRVFGECSGAVIAWCTKHRVTPNAFFNAVFSYVLSEFLHADDVTYCTVYNGRNDSRLAECAAMLVRTLPVCCSVNGGTAVPAFVESMQKQLMETMANDIVSFADLSSRYGLKSDLFFNYQGSDFIFDRIGGEKAEMIPLALSQAKAPLSVEIFLDAGVYRAEVTYRTDTFCKAFVSSFTDALITAAESFTAAEKLDDVYMLSEGEMKCFETMNDTGMPFEPVPAQTLFERQAAAHPQQTAVRTATASVTFGELDRRANALANALLANGVRSGEIIGMILERSELVPVTEIGILKAGCAFLPMLPSYPDDRLVFCMEDAGCRFVISEKGIIESKPGLFSPDRPYRALAAENLAAGDDTSAPDVIIAQDQPAYCIYTSGSTGKPKGVLIEHHNLSNFVQTAALCELMEKGSTVLCMASISFDMSITEMFFSLSRGKTISIATEEDIHNPDRLLTAFRNHGVDLMMMTPSFAWSLLSMPGFESELGQLRGVVLGAEAFRPALLKKLKALNPDMLIQNGYGPTECTQVCSVKTLREGEPITIGSPFPNMKFYIAGRNGHLLPRYATGELMICGEGVCRGYVNLPEKNAAAFTAIRGVRAYHSGDLVRINGEGEAEFCGRADNQVKIRGFRVELDEVEAVMQQFTGITQCRVIVRKDGAEPFLAGYFTASGPVDTGELTAFMKSKLTYYMVPAALMQLERMPLTPGGKLNTKALPEIRPAREKKAGRAPKRSLEQKITDLFREILGVDECFADDNFFEIGGTSLSASKAVMQLKAEGYSIEYQDIFDHQSAESLTEYLESAGRGASAPAAKAEDSAFPGQDEGVNELLRFNAMEHAADVRREPLGDVLLTGATGFLGIHILRELLGSEEGHILCLVRRGRFSDVQKRLKSSLVYYFEDDYEQAFDSRITVIEGDVTDDTLCEKLRGQHIDTVINCAASVRHYANDDSIEFVNVHGVENLIALAKEKQAKLIQISTTSVPGAHNDETYRINLKMPENRLFVVDDMNNQYIRSKYKAELKVLEAVRGGMRGKIIRVGNLMGRYSDGEFQTNMHTNAFLNGLRGFVHIGKCPISHSTDPMNFSPVDCTARAVVLLAGTNDEFTAFNADSRFTFDEMKVIDAMNRCGIPVIPVQDEEYYADFYRMMADPENNGKVSALLTNDRPDLHIVSTENRFTANVLYRLGFSWPFIDDGYLEKIITSLDTLDFFFMEQN
ncbi:MAG: hypothetical protein CW338_04630 [Clostridiales bacterium]|nr:hypothetical protein [Clostridiales bacterium]